MERFEWDLEKLTQDQQLQQFKVILDEYNRLKSLLEEYEEINKYEKFKKEQE